ncbi:MAG: hypothetical protein K0U70_02095 [Actinomycetia bacterium]|nr:hypothetical protein [Actinomycetes bacterium]
MKLAPSLVVITVSVPLGDRKMPTVQSVTAEFMCTAACCNFQANSLAAAASADSRRCRAAAVWPAATTLAGISVALDAGAAAGCALPPPAPVPAGTAGDAAAAAGIAAAGGPMAPGGSIIGAPPPIPAPAGAAGATTPGWTAPGETPPLAAAADTGEADTAEPPADNAGEGLAGAFGGIAGIPPPMPAPVDTPRENAAAGDPAPADPDTLPAPLNPPAAPGISPKPPVSGLEATPGIPPLPRPPGTLGVPPEPIPPPLPMPDIDGTPPLNGEA